MSLWFDLSAASMMREHDAVLDFGELWEHIGTLAASSASLCRFVADRDGFVPQGDPPGAGGDAAGLCGWPDRIGQSFPEQHWERGGEGGLRGGGRANQEGCVECADHSDPLLLVDVVTEAAVEAGLALEEMIKPFSWSEDFAHFGSIGPAVLFGLGSGVKQPPLHSKHYDFPDDLVGVGADLWYRIARRALLTARKSGARL